MNWVPEILVSSWCPILKKRVLLTSVLNPLSIFQGTICGSELHLVIMEIVDKYWTWETKQVKVFRIASTVAGWLGVDHGNANCDVRRSTGHVKNTVAGWFGVCVNRCLRSSPQIALLSLLTFSWFQSVYQHHVGSWFKRVGTRWPNGLLAF